MNRKNTLSPTIVTFESKSHAQEAFHQIRKTSNLTANVCGVQATKIEVRFHLSKHLTHLLRSASLLKRELKWAMCRPHSNTQSVELQEDPSKPSMFFNTIEELIVLKNQLIENKVLNPSSPAATIDRPLRGNRRRAESKDTYEANSSRNKKRAK